MTAEDYNTFASCNQSQKNTVLGFSVSEFRVHDLGAPNFPQTWEEEGCTCMEELKTSSEEKRQNTKLLLKKYIEP
jgi:hypothetical protein